MFTLMSIGSWFQQNWMLVLILVLAVAMIVPTYIKQKKEMDNRQELSNSIKKGTKIVTTAGVYGVVESVEETTDGKVVTIVTGSSKNPCTMTIHINAIMGIDNKTAVTETEETVEEKDNEINEQTQRELEELRALKEQQREEIEEFKQMKEDFAKEKEEQLELLKANLEKAKEEEIEKIRQELLKEQEKLEQLQDQLEQERQQWEDEKAKITEAEETETPATIMYDIDGDGEEDEVKEPIVQETIIKDEEELNRLKYKNLMRMNNRLTRIIRDTERLQIQKQKEIVRNEEEKRKVLARQEQERIKEQERMNELAQKEQERIRREQEAIEKKNTIAQKLQEASKKAGKYKLDSKVVKITREIEIINIPSS